MNNSIIPESAVKIGIIGDLHFPFELTPAVSMAAEILRQQKPDVIVVDGDLLDCYTISKYERSPSVKHSLNDEIQIGFRFLNSLRKDHPAAKIIYVEGNHEFRIKSAMIRNNPEMYDADFLPDKLRLDLLGIDWVGTPEFATKWTDTYFDVDGIKIGHFDRVNVGAGQTVRQLMIKKGGSFVQAHIHRAAIIHFTDIDGNVSFGVETPCLAKPPTYGNMTDWQRGVSFLLRDDAGKWHPHLIVFK